MISTISKHYPIIIVDNSDCALLVGLSQKYGINYVREEVKGVSVAKNNGSNLAIDYDFIFFLDDDLELTEGWKTAIDGILESETNYCCIGGRVIAKYDNKLNIPQKYLYLVGEKNFGEREKILSTDYLSGCNLLIQRKLFFDLGKFDLGFGHKDGVIGLNEDVLIQEQIRKRGFNIHYVPTLKFVHYWNGTEAMILERVRLQGIYDRMLDLRVNKIRFFLRLIKYLCFLAYYQVALRRKNIKVHYYDSLRYREYLFGKTIENLDKDKTGVKKHDVKTE
jgi:GT2 family glycosyltransferase